MGRISRATYVWILILIVDLISFSTKLAKRLCKLCNVINKYLILTFPHSPVDLAQRSQ
jgi:hypothetical protein